MSAILLFLAALVGAAPAPAAAAGADAPFFHARLLESEPADSARLDAAPERARLTFSEPVEVAELGLRSAAGASWSLEGEHASEAGDVVVAALPELPSGAWYQLRWRVLSRDGHPVQGTVTFGVEAAGDRTALGPPPSFDAADAPPPLAAAPAPERADAAQELGPPPDFGTVEEAGTSGAVWAARAGVDLALLALAGLLAFVAWAPGEATAGSRRTALALAVAAPLAATAQAWIWAGDALGSGAAAGARLDALGSLGTGRTLALQAGLAWLVLWALALARRPKVAAGLAFAAVLVGGALGHPAARSPWAAVPTNALHLAAVAAWTGGLLHLVTEAGSGAYLRTARRVSAVALAAVAVVAGTGVLQGVLLLAAPADLVETRYGLLLLAKAAGLGVLLLFGARHRYRLLPALEGRGASAGGRGEPERRLRRSVGAELAVAGAVVVLGAFLAHVPPAR